MNDRQMLYFNGMDITTGKYLMEPMAMDAFAAVAQKQTAQAQQAQPVQQAAGAGGAGVARVPTLAPIPSFDPAKLEEAGWGVIFTPNTDPAIYDALRPLLDLRKAQASPLSPMRYREYRGPDGWQPLESVDHFLQRHGATPGQVNPDQVPYYLLLVADPVAIIYTVQFNLDVQRAVGRIYFETPEEYASYAQSVIAAETGTRPLPRRAVLFASSNDPTTQLSCEELAMPLASKLKTDRPAWQVDTVTAVDATKARLGQLLGGGDPAALLFTATHGGTVLSVGDPSTRPLPHNDPSQLLQLKRQGCLICQGFDKSKLNDPSFNPADFYFSGEDIADSAQIPAMITFHFACFGAGTPLYDQFLLREGPSPADTDPLGPRLAPRPFVAYLPQRLLGHPKGGALATIGHVERAWGFTFQTDHKDDIATFQNALTAIMDGSPVGHAMQMFAERYSQLSTVLAQGQQTHAAQSPNKANYVTLWTACKDARNYVIVGDPAVRLPLTAASE